MFRIIFVLAILCSYWGLHNPATAQVPVWAFGALPEIDDAAVSPDGETIALLENIKDETVVRFFDLKTGEQSRGIKVGGVKARTLRWANNDRILLLVSQTQTLDTVAGKKTYEFFRYASVSKSKNDVTYLLARGDVAFFLGAGEILHMLPDEPNHILMAKHDPNFSKQRSQAQSRIGTSRSDSSTSATLNVYRVSLKTGLGKSVVDGNEDTSDWIADQSGTPVLRIDFSDRTNVKSIHKLAEKKKYVEVTRFDTDDTENIFIEGFAGDQRAIATSRVGKNTVGAYYFDLTTAQLSDPIFTHDTYDLSTLTINNGAILSFSYVGDTPQTVYLDKDREALENRLSAALKGARVSVISQSDSHDISIIKATYTDRPPVYYLYERESRALSLLGETYPRLNESNSGKRRKFDYQNADGFLIPGYLTLPPGTSTPENLPLIVLPHGGPESRDNLEFDWWAAAYASRGFAVYQPNFRGSSGYGNRFRRAGWGQWGRKMQDDISDGVRKLIADGIANADRICIVGASYGGYAALAGATLTPELYKCTVSVNGVSDLNIMIGSEASSGGNVGFWQRRIGSRFTDADQMASVSPARLVQNVRAPIMLVHGKDDTVVPYAQSRIMRQNLEKAGKDVTMIDLDGEDHWLSGAATRQRMLQESTAFIEKHIGQK